MTEGEDNAFLAETDRISYVFADAIIAEVSKPGSDDATVACVALETVATFIGVGIARAADGDISPEETVDRLARKFRQIALAAVAECKAR